MAIKVDKESLDVLLDLTTMHRRPTMLAGEYRQWLDDREMEPTVHTAAMFVIDKFQDGRWNTSFRTYIVNHYEEIQRVADGDHFEVIKKVIETYTVDFSSVQHVRFGVVK